MPGGGGRPSRESVRVAAVLVAVFGAAFWFVLGGPGVDLLLGAAHAFWVAAVR